MKRKKSSSRLRRPARILQIWSVAVVAILVGLTAYFYPHATVPIPERTPAVANFVRFEKSPLRTLAANLLEPVHRVKFVSLACGTGSPLRVALDAHFKKVVGVDVDSTAVEAVKKAFAQDARNPFLDESVTFVKSDPRGYVNQTKDIDVLQIADGNEGALASEFEAWLSAEAFETYYRSLSAHGIFVWLTPIDREHQADFFRRYQVAKTAWKKFSTDNFDRHVSVAREGDWAVVLVSRRAIEGDFAYLLDQYLVKHPTIVSDETDSFLVRVDQTTKAP